MEVAGNSKLDMALDQIVADRPRVRKHNKGRRTDKPKSATAKPVQPAAPRIDLGSKILVSNLHFGVTEADLKVCK